MIAGNRKKLVTAALGAAALAPAMLFAGAGTAQAATAWACPTVKPLPAYKVPFHLQNGQENTLWFPGIPTGTTWNVTITCEHGGLNNSQVIY